MGILQSLAYHLHILEAMAFNRKDAIDKVNELLSPIIEHLVKIAIYKQSNKDRDIQVEGWESEIISWLEQIYIHANKLKKRSHLKMRDYLLCLGDDLAHSSIVRAEINKWSRTYNGKCNRDTDAESLRLTLWAILEAQFKAMSNRVWNEFSLLNHSLYTELKG